MKPSVVNPPYQWYYLKIFLIVMTGELLLRPKMLLDILQCIGQPPQQNYAVRNVISAEVQKI